jgi:hypothetical protein
MLMDFFILLRRCQRPLVAATLVAGLCAGAFGSDKPDTAFLKQRCFDCHEGKSAEGNLDLAALSQDLADGRTQQRWVRIFDRVKEGEMPPADAEQPPPEERAAFLAGTGKWITDYQRTQDEQLGRVRGRRLTRRELERSLHDLLGIDIPLADQLPEEPRTAQFSTVASGQSMSHFQLQRQLEVVDLALDEAFRRAQGADDRYERDFNHVQVARRPERLRTREPEILDERAVVWSSGLIFYGRIPATTAPESGWYRFNVRASALKAPESGGVWCTVRSGVCVSSAPLLAWIGSLEAVEEPREWTFEAWLPKGHMIEIRPGDSTLKRARFAGGQVGNGEGEPQNVPGIAIERVTMERFHRGASNEEIHERLLGWHALSGRETGDDHAPSGRATQDVEMLMKRFARRAFRRPVENAEVAGYVEMARSALAAGRDMTSALKYGYRAILCSPRFLYLTEMPGRLDDHAIATRLSYFLRGTTPDPELTRLADAGQLHTPQQIKAQVERLLTGRGGRQFVEDFAAEWLDLNLIDFTEPDSKLFPDFDPVVQNSLLAETHTFLEALLRENRSVTQLISSDFTFLNSRLARFYGIESVTGDELRRVSLPDDSRRGGVLTQGAILKVTANGTTTSPVVRGVWVSERLLGEHIPPPPDNVPAIEPDIRGAKTIREMLAKHRADDACASCHVKIDPPGFALENFDPAGRWRERYVQLIDGRREQGPVIDPSYELPDGQKFQDISEFRSLLCAQPEKLARGLAEKLVVYGTGAPISFADRAAIDDIVKRAVADNYGLRSIVHAVAQSPIFLTK